MRGSELMKPEPDLQSWFPIQLGRHDRPLVPNFRLTMVHSKLLDLRNTKVSASNPTADSDMLIAAMPDIEGDIEQKASRRATA